MRKPLFYIHTFFRLDSRQARMTEKCMATSRPAARVACQVSGAGTFIKCRVPLSFLIFLLTGCTTTPPDETPREPLVIHDLDTTLVTSAAQTSTLHAHTAHLDENKTLTGTAVTATLSAMHAPTLTVTAPYAEWHTTTDQLIATGPVTVTHDSGWLQASGGVCNARKQTIFLKGPIESVLST